MVSFVILHYKNLSDTIECIESINKLEEDKSIIVVDNGTLSKDEINMLKKYTNDLVINKENLGFANGNNSGAKYAINKYNPDFLCVINNDTVINQKNFINEINNLYQEYNFDILGPKILPENSASCNPFNVYKTLKQVRQRISYTKKLIKIYQNKFLRKCLFFYVRVKNIFRKKISNTNGGELVLNVGLHGCALIFSKKYYEKFNDVFYPGTFLFHEEEFLYLRCQEKNLISLYSPSLEIYHKEGQSINKEFPDDLYKRLIFRNQEILKSLKLLEQEMLKDVRK